MISLVNQLDSVVPENATKLKLYGFNNLTKSLSISIYDCRFVANQQTANYLDIIATHYHHKRLIDILTEVCHIIGANILNIASQEYEPHGTSVNILVAEKADAKADEFLESAKPGPLSNQILDAAVGHLDKSHICLHTYPESHPVNGIHTFRADIEVASCGVISPLKALNYLLHQFNADVITLDYRVRGFTRDVDGNKHFIDHKIDSISDFISSDTKAHYHIEENNQQAINLFTSKMKKQLLSLDKQIITNNATQITEHARNVIHKRLNNEMNEIFDAEIV